MSRRIFLDIEEALSREVRRISFHEARTVDKVVLKETYDPFTGEIIQVPIEPNYYASKADTGHINYPNFFIRLMKTREDRFSGRVVPQYGQWCLTEIATSPKAFEIVLSGGGLVSATGNDFTTTAFQIRKVQPGQLLRILSGNNKGTYIVDDITVNSNGNHIITVTNTIAQNLPALDFDPVSRLVRYLDAVDLHTVKVGDVFNDSLSNTFNITAVDPNTGTLTIDGTTVPNTDANNSITRIGDVFTDTDLSLVRFIAMDPTKPIKGALGADKSTSAVGLSPEIPLDAYYRIRIDSKTRQNHIAVLNRVWEEFNPPRTALPVIKRTAASAETLLTADVTTGGSNQITVETTENLNVGDPIFIFDDLGPTKRVDGKGFAEPFKTTIKSILSATELELEDTVPDTFVTSKCAKVVSNAEFKLFMFHFQDHVTKDVEDSQYWVHEFTFLVQLWVDRLEDPSEVGVVTDIQTPIEDFDSNVIIE
jgi:hypothetical protein